MEDGIFVPRGHLKAFNITFDTQRDPQPDDRFQHQSKAGVQLAFKASGESSNDFEHIAAGDAGISVKFSLENAILFSLHGCYESRIDDQYQLANNLLNLPKINFPQDYAIVTHLVSAASGTILMSSSGESRVEMRVNAGITGVADLARADIGLSIAHMKDLQTQIVASDGLTPLFRAARIHQRWFRPRRIESLGSLSLADVLAEIDSARET
jgi:hypothetical protein